MRALLLALVVTTAACSFGRTMRAADAMEKTSTPDEPLPPRQTGAVALEEQAFALAAEGDHVRAAVTLERALRLSPNDARLWLSLARVRFDQADYAKARSLAERAAQLAGRDTGTANEARRLASLAARRQ